MKKYTLIKFFKGEATEAETDSIIEWVKRSPENMKYFAREKILFTALQMERDDEGAQAAPSEMSAAGGGRRRVRWGRIAASTGIAAAVASLLFAFGIETEKYLERRNSVVIPAKAVPECSVYTEKGVKGFVILPDSSKVWLNSDTKIVYPQQFAGRYRNVKLIGEAYFEVAKDSLHPMLVNTDRDFTIEVLGTSFNVKSYDNEDVAVTTLYSGSIKMNYRERRDGRPTDNTETVMMKPNDTFSYYLNATQEGNVAVPSKDAEMSKAWKDGVLIFDNTSMDEVIKMLERWHGTKFIVKNDKIYNYKLSAEFSSESIVQILEIIRMLMPVTYTCDGNVVTLE